MIQPEPIRTAPVALHPEILRRVVALRIRLIFVDPAQCRVGEGDALWVQEAFSPSRHQGGGDWLRLRYQMDGAERQVFWPKAKVRPAPGELTRAERMPMPASRYTLHVRAAERIRLQQLTEHQAIDAGVNLAGLNGFEDPLSGGVWLSAHEAFARMWDRALGGESLGPMCWTCNPEVLALTVRATARNIRELMPGVGSGGVW